MTDHPSTFNGETTGLDEAMWEDRASIVAAGPDAPLGEGGATLMRGSFAEMIRHITHMPENERRNYIVRKAGDRIYTAEEAVALAGAPNFPAAQPD